MSTSKHSGDFGRLWLDLAIQTMTIPQQLTELRTTPPPALPLGPKCHNRHSNILGCPQLVPKTTLRGPGLFHQKMPWFEALFIFVYNSCAQLDPARSVLIQASDAELCLTLNIRLVEGTNIKSKYPSISEHL